jgi:hypothetical protein
VAVFRNGDQRCEDGSGYFELGHDSGTGRAFGFAGFGDAEMIRLVLVLFMFVALLTQSGCTIAMGGAKETDAVVFIEPGGVVRVATDDKIKVMTTTADKKQVVTEKNIAGMYVLPESTYLKLTQEWEKNHPAPATVVLLKPSAVVPKKKLETVVEEVPAEAPLIDENADHEAWAKEKFGDHP